MRTTIVFITLFLVSFTLFAGNNKVDKATEAKVKAMAVNQQLEFIENKGQIANSEGKPADNVLFKASYGNCDIYITDKGLSYVFYKIEEKESDSKSTKLIKSGSSPMVAERSRSGRGGGEVNDTNRKVSYYRLDMDLVGATILKENIIKEEESKQGHYNYFYAHCPEGIYNVKAYGKITIKNIYKGIDWVIYTNKNNKEQPIKYDFIVHPEANYNNIKIKYINAQNISLLDKDTKLKIQTIAGTIEEGNIYSYQNNKEEIKSKYIFNNDSTISFTINDYDKTQDLVIDPLVWATYYGGNNYDNFLSICVDSKDNIYITGWSISLDFPTQQLNGAYWQLNIIGVLLKEDVIILKFNCRGVRLWATYYGGSDQDGATAINVDNNDNIYIIGGTKSSDFPLQQLSGAYWQATNYASSSSSSTAFILKFNDHGIRQWATFYGGTDTDVPYSICFDSHDNIYITGVATSLNFPTQQLSGAYWQPNFAGESDIFILKFNDQGLRLWSTFYGGELWEIAYSICVDSHDNLFITGTTCSGGFPTQQKAGAYWQPTYFSTGNVYISFILEFDKNGVRQWSTYYGGSNVDIALSICADSKDNIYITGYTDSYDFPVLQQSGAYFQSTNAGCEEVFILKFNNAGKRLWATYLGGIYYERGQCIKADKNDNIYLTGSTESPNFPLHQLAGEFWQQTLTGTDDAFIMKLNEYGVILWSTLYGCSHGVGGYGLAINNINDIFVVGSIQDSGAYTVDPGNGAYYDNNSHNYNDGFILKFSSNNIPTTLHTNKNIICSWDNSSITLSADGSIANNLNWYTEGCGQNYIGKKSPLLIASPKVTTTYYASSESSCYSYCDSIKIYVENCDSSDIYIPNAFTPNGDGLNDVFKIETLAEFSEFHLYIYDRWGEELFESNDKNKGWDGIYKGKLVPNGVYVYLVKAIIKDTNEYIKRNGTVTVVR